MPTQTPTQISTQKLSTPHPQVQFPLLLLSPFHSQKGQASFLAHFHFGLSLGDWRWHLAEGEAQCNLGQRLSLPTASEVCRRLWCQLRCPWLNLKVTVTWAQQAAAGSWVYFYCYTSEWEQIHRWADWRDDREELLAVPHPLGFYTCPISETELLGLRQLR